MNRDQIIDKTALAMYHGDARLANRYRKDAVRILDAILPQVTTVEELRHLLIRVSQAASSAVVIDNLNRSWTLFENDQGDWWAQRLGDQDEDAIVTTMLDLDEDYDGDDLDVEPWQWLLPGPLTVVWTPDDDS